MNNLTSFSVPKPNLNTHKIEMLSALVRVYDISTISYAIIIALIFIIQLGVSLKVLIKIEVCITFIKYI